uniref:Suppressor protein srp40-like protein n=1 Tax=Triatoma infestans TaxID=30076 RepID=A0A170Y9N7_TRIIF
MSRRPKRPEPIGPLSLLKSVRDQIQIVQEKRGITPDENNFINLLAVILQQSGNAMYAVFTMFMALLPVGNIIIHTVHFMLERLIDIMTTRKRKDLWVKGGIFIAQSICIYLVIHFVLAAIFVPIFAMQTTIVSKILFMEDTSSDLCQAKAGFTFQDAMPVQPPMIKPVRPKPSLKDILCPVLSIKKHSCDFYHDLFLPPPTVAGSATVKQEELVSR